MARRHTPAWRWSRTNAPALLLVLMTAVLFYDLGRWPLLEPDEGRNAEVAREMLMSGDWFVPHFNGLPFLDKPVGLFWMIAAAFRLFGVNESAARLPSVLAAVVLITTTFALGRLLLGPRRGILAATVVATSPLVLIFARLTIFDMAFSALATLALWSLTTARLVGPPTIWVPVAGFLMGLATLTKGPVGLVVPLLAWMAGRGALPAPERQASIRPVLLGVLTFVIVVLPWVIVVTSREPAFLRYALLDESVLRFTSAERFQRGGPPYYHLVVLGAGLGVWTLVLFVESVTLLRVRWGDSHKFRAIRFAARAAGAIILFFSVCASKRPGYVIPAVVPLGVLIAAAVSRTLEDAAKGLWLFGLGAIVFGGLCGATALLGTDVATRLLSLEAGPALSPRVLGTTGTLLTVWGLAMICIARKWPALTFGLGALLFPALYVSLLEPLSEYANSRSSREVARFVGPGGQLVAYRKFQTSLPFYLGRHVVLATTTGRELTSNFVTGQIGRFLGRGPLVRPRHLWKRLDGGTSLFVLTTPYQARLVTDRTLSSLDTVYFNRRSVLLLARRTRRDLTCDDPVRGGTRE